MLIRKRSANAYLAGRGKSGDWRRRLGEIVGEDCDLVWRALVGVAQGRVVVPVMPDGREGPPIVPSAADMVRAASELAHMYAGRPVDQDRVLAAMATSSALAEIASLPDGELAARVRGILAREPEIAAPALPEGEKAADASTICASETSNDPESL